MYAASAAGVGTIEAGSIVAMHWYWLALGLLATWRVSHLLSAEDGPWQVLARLRRRVGDRFWGALMDCFACVSLWVAAPIAASLADTPRQGVLLWLACSGGGMLLERVITRGMPHDTPPHGHDLGHGDRHSPGAAPSMPLYVEHPEGDRDVLLR